MMKGASIKRIVLLVALSLLLALPVSAKDLHIGFCINSLDLEYFQIQQRAALDAAKELGVKVTVLSAEYDPVKQANQVENFISERVDAITICPTDSNAIVAAAELAIEHGIPVFAFDNGVVSDKITTFIESDNYSMGEIAARRIIDMVGEKGTVIELQGQLGSESQRKRSIGFRRVMDNYPDIKIIAQTANYSRAEGLTVMENLLAGNPDVLAVCAHNDEMALGAIEAILAAGFKDKGIVVTGMDGIEDAFDSIRRGEMDATVAQQPYVIARMGVEMAVAHLRGEEVPEYVAVETILVTKENVDEL